MAVLWKDTCLNTELLLGCGWSFSVFGCVHVGRSSLADDILSNNFKEISPIFGSKIEGKDKFKSVIDGLYSVSSAAFAWNPAAPHVHEHMSPTHVRAFWHA